MYRGEVTRVRCFREKPQKDAAEQFLAAGNFYWNSGMFLWSAKTLVNALRQYLPETAVLLEKIAATWGTRKFDETLRKLYPKCEDKSVDYGILEPRSQSGEEARTSSAFQPTGDGTILVPGQRTSSIASHRVGTRTMSLPATATFSSMPMAITFTPPANSSPPSECKVWWSWTQATHS